MRPCGTRRTASDAACPSQTALGPASSIEESWLRSSNQPSTASVDATTVSAFSPLGSLTDWKACQSVSFDPAAVRRSRTSSADSVGALWPAAKATIRPGSHANCSPVVPSAGLACCGLCGALPAVSLDPGAGPTNSVNTASIRSASARRSSRTRRRSLPLSLRAAASTASSASSSRPYSVSTQRPRCASRVARSSGASEPSRWSWIIAAKFSGATVGNDMSGSDPILSLQEAGRCVQLGSACAGRPHRRGAAGRRDRLGHHTLRDSMPAAADINEILPPNRHDLADVKASRRLE